MLVLLAALTLICTTGSLAMAETVSVIGAPGASGTTGATGTPGLPGTPGQDADTATAIADAPGEDNTASARGGSGGNGGWGGDATPNSGADGGDGANGGDGGDAIADATTVGSREVLSTATGGRGGFVGNGGLGSTPGSSGQPGMQGGDGGDATATGRIVNDLGTAAPFFRQEGLVIATGGNGSGEGASGGSAHATLTGEITGGDTSQSADHLLTALATGGNAGSQSNDTPLPGGDAIAEVTGSSTHGNLIIVADADGGRSASRPLGITEGPSGNATAIAHGTHSGSGWLSVAARASPGDGSGLLGSGQAIASGIATNGANVTVEASLSGGSEVELRDAVSGSTSGLLELIQRVDADISGISPSGIDAVTSLNASNTGGGDLAVDVTAGGGIGPGEGGDGGNGIIEFIDAIGAQNVTVEGMAIGGRGARSFSTETPHGSGGTASIGSMIGRSTGGGAVLVEATVQGGASGGNSDSGFIGGYGGSVAIDNAVDGETTGELTLRQIAIAGAGLEPPPGTLRDASSRLERTRSAEHFTVHSEAQGLAAEAYGNATNTSGSVSVEVVASGATRLGITGGDAFATAVGTTHANGQAVEVGADDLVNATGGRGIGDTNSQTFEAGGLASSNSSGVAMGDSQVSVFDRAVGGEGAFSSSFSFPRPVDHAGTDGGTATSQASAINAGGSAVLSDAKAIGGMGGNAQGDDMMAGRGGDATASASGESTGGADVRVRAEAIGGRGGYRNGDGLAGQGGDASVTNLTGSTSGLLTLEAIATGGRGGAESILRFHSSLGRGGDAHIALDASNGSGGALEIIAEGTATRGGRVTFGTIRGSSSTGADVSVSAILDEGGDRFANPLPEGTSFRPSISLIDAVQGETSGTLRLLQAVDGGGEGGIVENQLSDVGSRAGVALETLARARDGSDAIARSNAMNDEGWATTDSSAHSDSGREAIAEAGAVGAGSEETRATASSRLDSTTDGELSQTAARAVSTADGSVVATANSVANGGADAIASAYGQNNGASEVFVSAAASSAGEGGGRLEADAEGFSTKGGDVSVSASASRSEEVVTASETVLRDAVHGGTSGVLSLDQRVFSRNGDVRTSLDAENAGGGALDINVFATSLTSFLSFGGSTSGGDAILGDVIGRSTTGANVDIDVVATGNAIRMESNEDPLTSSRILGVSTRGDVLVRAGFSGTNSLFSSRTETTIRGDAGHSVGMQNAVDGETEGGLTLIQNATAGRGANVSVPFLEPDVIGEAGAGGDAQNHLEKAGAFKSLQLEGTALGGLGGNLSNAQQGHAGDGGDSELSLNGSNTAGRVELQGSAWSGAGGGDNFRPGSGGDAHVDFRATTDGDDHAVVIGRESPIGPELSGAKGGVGGSLPFIFGLPTPGDGNAGLGGNAVSRSEGHARSDSTVDVVDRALGGNGGQGSPGRVFPPRGSGGHGGEATSEAIGIGGGRSRVAVRSNASGGHGGLLLISGGNGGNARAFTRAEGFGEIQASATALGGTATTNTGSAGSAHARTEAFGKSGSALADAATGAGSFGGLRAAVTRDVRKLTYVDAAATYGAPIATRPLDVDGSAFLAGHLAPSVLLDSVHVTGSLESLFNETPGAVVKTIGGWQAAGGTGRDSFQTTELDITLTTPDSNDDLILAIFDLQETNGGFEELVFRLEVFGEAFGDEMVFSDIKTARSFFASAIVLGAAYLDGFTPGDVPAVRAIFDVTLGNRQSIGMSIAAVVVPEPSTAILLGFGLMLIGRRRRSLNRLK